MNPADKIKAVAEIIINKSVTRKKYVILPLGDVLKIKEIAGIHPDKQTRPFILEHENAFAIFGISIPAGVIEYNGKEIIYENESGTVVFL